MHETRNTIDTPHTVVSADGRRSIDEYQWCKCGTCGHVEICTPRSDFYGDKPGEPLECESCLYIRATQRAAKRMVMS